MPPLRVCVTARIGAAVYDRRLLKSRPSAITDRRYSRSRSRRATHVFVGGGSRSVRDRSRTARHCAMAVPAMLEHGQDARGTLVAIFGSTDERATGPLATRVRIVKKERSAAPAEGASAPSISPAWPILPRKRCTGLRWNSSSLGIWPRTSILPEWVRSTAMCILGKKWKGSA